MSKKAVTLIEIEGGQEINRFTHLNLIQNLFDHHEFHLQIPIEVIEGEGNYTFKESKNLIGKQIAISLESDLVADVQSPPFKGVISNVSIVRTSSSGNDILLSGKSNSVLTDSGLNYRSFEDMSWKEVVDEVLKVYPSNLLTYRCEPAHQAAIPYLVQYRESDFHFLQRIANRLGEWCFYDGSEMQLGQPEWPDAIPLLLSRDLFEFQLGLLLQPTAYQSHYYDYSQSTVYQNESTNFEARHLDSAYGEKTFQESAKYFQNQPAASWLTPSANQKDLDSQVEIQLDQQASNMVYMDASSEHIGLGLGKLVSVSANKGEDNLAGLEEFGEFIVINIKHYIRGDGDYRNEFRAIPKDAGIPPLNASVSVPKARPESAIVKENHDPKKLGRVRVQLYWQKEGELTPWIRLINSHGGAQGGFFVIPEKGDEVIIDYEQHHPDRPFVMGSVYNKEGKPADNWSDKDNNVKSIKSKSGNEIMLVDKGGKESIKILNKGGEHAIILTMESGGSISISTSNQLNLSGKNIAISAEESITMDSKNLIITTKEDCKVTATKNIITQSDLNTSITAKKNAIIQSTEASAGMIAETALGLIANTATLQIQAEGDLSIGSNANVGIQATANVEIAATAQVNVSGEAMTNVSSTGPVIVSGTLVQLN